MEKGTPLHPARFSRSRGRRAQCSRVFRNRKTNRKPNSSFPFWPGQQPPHHSCIEIREGRLGSHPAPPTGPRMAEKGHCGLSKAEVSQAGQGDSAEELDVNLQTVTVSTRWGGRNPGRTSRSEQDDQNIPEYGRGGPKAPRDQRPPPPPTHLRMTEAQGFRATFFRGGKGRRQFHSLKLNLNSRWWGSPGGSDGKESACNEGGLGSIPGLERSPGGRHGNPLIFLPGESPWTKEPGGL